MSNNKSLIQTSWFSLIGNICLAIIKALAGIWGNSYVLIADAIESTSDVFSSILVLLGLKYSTKPADENHPYGHGKVEPLITFVIVLFLVISAFVIAYESIQNIQTSQEVPKSWTLLVLAPIIIWKEVSYQVVLKRAKAINSSSLKADAWHHRSDAITSIMAFLGISIALIMGEGCETADDWAALFASGLILYNSYRIFRPALGEVMDEHQYDNLKKEVIDESDKVEGVLGVRRCLIRKSGIKYFLDLKILVKSHITVKAGHDIATELRCHLQKVIDNVEYVHIHVEPFDEPE